MSKTESTNVGIQDIIDFFNKYPVGDGPVRLNQATVIDNQQNFVDSHISVLLRNSGKRVFSPYYSRLLQFYKIKKKEWEKQKK